MLCVLGELCIDEWKREDEAVGWGGGAGRSLEEAKEGGLKVHQAETPVLGLNYNGTSRPRQIRW